MAKPEPAPQLPYNLTEILGAVQRSLAELSGYLNRPPMHVDAGIALSVLAQCYQRMDEFQTGQAALAAQDGGDGKTAAKQ